MEFYGEARNDLVSSVFTSLFPYMSIVTLTFDLRLSKSKGLILLSWLACLPSLTKKKYNGIVSIVFTTYVYYDLDLWPPTSKFNRAHPLTMANMSAKFYEELHNGVETLSYS